MTKYLNKTKGYLIIIVLFLGYSESHAVDFHSHPQLERLVETMVKEDGYTHSELDGILQNAMIDLSVITLINYQPEAMPWYQYRKMFINQERIKQGIAYWNKHQATLERAQQEFGVSPSIIVALLGVETHFGSRMGNRRVLDALVTLTTKHQRRRKYFTHELRVFLNTMREQNIAPQSVVGSFAGAVGIPQFMPSSYQAYAVDFNGNKRRDLINEDADAIGSVANYLKRHGWKKAQDIVLMLPQTISQAARKLISKSARPKLTSAQLKAASVHFTVPPGVNKMALLQLEEADGYRYIIGFNNFYTITRYNHSVNYAMAIVELSLLIAQQRAK